jgi:hypothetical protein
MNEHGIALVAFWVPGMPLNDWGLLMQCECGWRRRLSSPCTLDFAAGLGAEHRQQQVAAGDPG